MNMNRLLKTIFQTGGYIMDDPGRAAAETSDRVRQGVYDLSDRLRGEDRTWQYVLTFAAGVGLGVGATLLMSDRGEGIRETLTDNFERASDRVRTRAQDFATGT